MVLCTRKGCGKEFDPSSADVNEEACKFHSGFPCFREGLKSWSCCPDSNRAVIDFNDFLALPGCATGSHSTELPVAPPKPVVAPAPTTTTAGGKEVYGAVPAPKPAAVAAVDTLKPVSTPFVEEQDDEEAILIKGVSCKRKACGQSWDGEDREGEECYYHPGAPIFHEGSKGYSCCKRRTLDFDEFLEIKGCRQGRHLFVGPKKEDKEELVECRTDHYQTPDKVMISIFGKGADKETSKVTFAPEEMQVDLLLPSRKRFTKTFALYGPIDPAKSSYTIFGTKSEISLAKADGRSWPSITALDPALARNFVAQLAFSAGGGRGTTGSKEMVLDGANAAARS